MSSYQRLVQNDWAHKEEDNFDRKPDHEQTSKIGRIASYRSVVVFLLLTNLVSVLALAGVLRRDKSDVTAWAGLSYNATTKYMPSEGKMSHEEEELFWMQSLDVSPGVVALGEQELEGRALPDAQRFPWDESKGLYIISAYHGLHCLRQIRDSIMQYRSNSTQTHPKHHVDHCLRTILDDIKCAADDTPLYTGNQPAHSTGLHQPRMCRDWQQLERWAARHTGCWHYPVDSDRTPYWSLDSFRFCPPDSPYFHDSQTKWIGVQPPDRADTSPAQ